jgi:sigma-B regulation protein RsbU (phosphoserine phosphatase)
MLWLFWVSVKDSKKFVTPIVKLTNGVKEIAKGDLDKKLDIKTGDEIEVLADGVNNMTSDLKEYMKDFSNAAAEKERIATELNVAKNIQAGMLPSVDPDFSNNKKFDLAATMIPAKEVGGDFYDFYMLDESHLAVTVADVSGKGVGAALFMVISKTLLKDLTMIDAAFFDGKEPDVASIVERANKFLYDNNEEKMFVTVFYGVLNLKTGEFVYVNAGHNPPMVRYQKDREFSFIRNEKRNPIIGVKRKIKYQEYRLTLSPGDMIFFYTDGITEAMNSQRELYNEKRLKSALDNMSDECKANDIISTVYEDVKLHVGDAEQSDDMTLLGLVYKRGESVGEEGIL